MSLATTTALADSLLTLPISQPKTYLPGGHGDHRSLLLELKIIADVGLVGFPNVSAFIHLMFFCVTLTPLLCLCLSVCVGGQVVSAARSVQRAAQSGELPLHHAAPLCRSGGVLGEICCCC